MLLHLKDFFTKEQCSFLSDVLLGYYKNNSLTWEGNDQHYKNSYGSTIKEFESILEDITPKIKILLKNDNIVKVNSYSRIYFNDSILKKHVDREDLEYTLSVCIFDNTNKKWPLFVEHDGGIAEVITNVGDGGLILGTKMPHWREKLVCDENQMIMQCFFHWKTIK